MDGRTRRESLTELAVLLALALRAREQVAQRGEATPEPERRGGWRRDGITRLAPNLYRVRYDCSVPGCSHKLNLRGTEAQARLLKAELRKRVEQARYHHETWCPTLERQARHAARERAAQEREALFSAVAEKYLAWSAAARRSHPSVRSWMKPLVAAFGDKPLRAITEGDVLAYREGRLREGTGAPTVNRELGLLSSLFGLAHKLADQWGIPRDPQRGNPVRGIKRLDEPTRVRYFTPDERARLLAGLPVDVHATAIVARHTGLRRGELLRLEWPDVDLVAAVATLRKTKSNKVQHVPLNSVVLEILRSLPRQSARVFPSLSVGRLRYQFEKARRQGGIEDAHWHDWRHDLGSHLVMKGESIYTVKDLLRHSDVRVTERYAHLAPGHLKAALERLAEDEPAPPSVPNSVPDQAPLS
jgi:integrase